MYTYITQTTLLTMCNSNTFRLSKDLLQAVRLMHNWCQLNNLLPYLRCLCTLLACFSHFPSILYARCLSFSVQWHFGEWVSYWVHFPRWYAAIFSWGAPASSSLFLNISTIDSILPLPPHTEDTCPSLYHTLASFSFLWPELYLNFQSVTRSKHTTSRLWKKKTVS